LVRGAHTLADGAELVLVAADIPLARTPINGRRQADNLVSTKYGARGCSTHSPSATRPGPISASLRNGFAASGFQLATTSLVLPALLETYPHPALMMLMKADRRLPYKLARAQKDVPIADRWLIFVRLFQSIVGDLGGVIEGIELDYPTERVPLTALKPLEDQIDALVCAWVGIRILSRAAVSMGDDDAAIWLPVILPTA
jgi:predicted RNase H-like nuclease